MPIVGPWQSCMCAERDSPVLPALLKLSTTGRFIRFLAILLACLNHADATAINGTQLFEQLQMENRTLREQIETLDARREMFRWSYFQQGPALRSGSVMKTAVLPDGRLAFATDNRGLVLYDGVSLEILDRASGLPDDFVTSVAAPDSGSIWIGTGSGLVLYERGRTSRPENLPAGLQSSLISCLLPGRSGGMWVGTQNSGLWRLSTQGWEYVCGAPDSLGGLAAGINDLAADPSGDGVWIATAGEGLWRVDSSGIRKYPSPLGPGSEEIYCLLCSPDGLLWIGASGAGAGFMAGGQCRGLPLPSAEGSGVTCLAGLSGGDILFGTTDGTYIYEAATARFNRLPLPAELTPYPVVSAVEKHGSLWLSPSGQGLHVYDRELVKSFGPDEGLPSTRVFSLQQSVDGDMWCATGDGLARLEGGVWRQPEETGLLPDRLVTCLAFGPDGAKYFGTYAGALLLEPDGSSTVIDRDSGLNSNMINDIQAGPDSALWIATEGGGLVRRRNAALQMFVEAEALPSAHVQAVLCEADGSVWAATRKGIALIRDGRILESAPDGSPVSPGAHHFTALALAVDGSLWAASYGQGAWRRLPGKGWTQHGSDQGLASDEVYSVARASAGRMAFGTALGLSLYDGSAWRNYGPQDGVGPGAVRCVFTSADSALWLCVEGQGIVRFDPDRFDPPETWITSPIGRACAVDPSGQPICLMSLTDSLDSPESDGDDSRIYMTGGWFSRCKTVSVDSLKTDSLTLRLHASTPWQPGESGAFRFSWKMDQGPWSGFSARSEISLKDLSRGQHVLLVRSRGPHLRNDPTPAVYRFAVDMPGPWSDWRIYAAGGIFILALMGLLGRQKIAWWVISARRRGFQPITPNPFQPNSPLAPGAPLPGRDTFLESIIRPEGNDSVILCGPPRSGVSSLLLHAEALATESRKSAVLVDLAAPGLNNIQAVLQRIAERLSGEPAQTIEDTSPESLVTLVRDLGKPVLLLFDNAELLCRLAERDSHLAARFTAALREMVQKGDGAALIFGLHDQEKLRKGLPVFSGMSRLASAGDLSMDAASQALESALDGKAALKHQARDLLAGLSGGQPCLLQHLGFAAVERMNSAATNLLEPELAEQAAEDLVQSPPGLLLDRWDDLSRPEKLLFSAAVSVQSRTSRGGISGLADITMILRSHGLTLLDEELNKAAVSLAARNLIRFDPSSGRLRMDDTLLGRWVKNNHPLESVSASEDYDSGDILRQSVEAMGRSFRAGERLERLFDALHPALRFEWAAWLPCGDNNGVMQGFGQCPDELPGSLPAETTSILSSHPGAIQTGRDDSHDWTGQFPAGTLLVPEFLRGVLDGVFAFGPREGGQRYSRRELSLLETVAEQAAVSLENVRLYERETERERMRLELETARRMQMAILPERSFSSPGMEIFAFISPASEVGGDYFDYRRLDSGRLAFVIGDVSGHGLSAGTLVSMTKSCLYNQFRVDDSVTAVLTAMNDMVRGALSERLLMTFCYAVFDTVSRECSYSIAGHPFPYRLTADGELIELELGAYPLGAIARAKFRQQSFNYSPGDLFVFYSDGIVEGVDPDDAQYGFARFEQSIRRNAAGSPEMINSAIMKDFHDFARGAPQQDDITLVIIRAV